MRQAQVLSDKDKQRILSYIAKNSFPARNRAMLMLSWLAGMRVGEIAALKFADAVDATYSSGVGRLYAEDLIVKIAGTGGTIIVSA